MKVVIPLAGFGTRLRPHTYTRPKPMLSVAGKPILGHLLDKIMGLDIDEYIFIVGYLGDQVEAYVKSTYKLNARFVEQKELLGQAHAIWLARETLGNDPVFIIFVDTLFEADLGGLGQIDTDALVFVKEVEDPRRFGVVSLNEAGRVTRFVEKPATMENRLAVVGLYYFQHAQPLISAIETLMAQKKTNKGEYFLADAMQLMLQNGQTFRTRQVSAWLDCGVPETVLETNRYLLEHGHDNSGAYLGGPGVVVNSPAFIDPSAKITNSVIGPYVTIGANCTIDKCILQDTIIDEETICREMVMQKSLVGRKALLEGRARTVNIGDSSAVSVD